MLRQALQFQIKGIGKQRGITAGGGGGFFRLPQHQLRAHFAQMCAGQAQQPAVVARFQPLGLQTGRLAAGGIGVGGG